MLPMRDIFRNAVCNQCLPAIHFTKNTLLISNGSQINPGYAAQKRQPERGIKYERGAFRNFTCNTMVAGSAAIISGQTKIQPHPIVSAIES
jgi:hypothetical protein